jgi:hypothetical protein
MARPQARPRVLLVVAAFSRHEKALEWARLRLERLYGPVALTSAPFPFVQTDYYERSMGPGLSKVIWAFAELIEMARLPAIKLATIELEEELARSGEFPEQRPLNIDPGYLDLSKLVLASAKDHSHRLYLADGIFGEVTLYYREKAWHPWPWTFPDYREPHVRAFFETAREHYRKLRDGE